ncbi:MAG: hypothetical protein JXQ71_07010 [Verrucomicrobia bacterium]|nr:hypothetical protein [Verrucomicrobiota bacterium]
MVAATLGLVVGLGNSCGRPPVPKSADFSKSNAVGIALGDPQREYGGGLQHAHFEQDGLTTPAVLGGVACRRLNLQSRDVGYLYFTIAPTFKRADTADVIVEVHYFDAHPGTLGLEFDASQSGHPPASAYTAHPWTVPLAGSQLWQTAGFPVAGATFCQAQHSGSDFRVCVRPPALHVRRVSVTRQSGLVRHAPAAADYSRRDRASIFLGEGGLEQGDGIRHLYYHEDGRTLAASLGGVTCRQMRSTSSGLGYMYFALAPSFKRRRAGPVVVDVEYFDDHRGELGLEFDASPSATIPNAAYASPGPPVPLAGSKRWEQAAFWIAHPTFRNAQNAHADFRLWVRPAPLHVRRLTVTRVRKPPRTAPRPPSSPARPFACVGPRQPRAFTAWVPPGHEGARLEPCAAFGGRHPGLTGEHVRRLRRFVVNPDPSPP